ISAEESVVTIPAGEHVVAGLAVEDQPDRCCVHAGGVDHIIASASAHAEGVVRGLGPGHRHRGGEPGDRYRGSVPGDRSNVAAVSPLDDHGVGFAVGAAEVDGDIGHARAGEIVDGDRVRPAQGDEVDLLYAAEVHNDAGDVAG